MNVREALREAIERLTSAQVPSASTTAEVLLMHVLRRDRTFLHAHPEWEMIPDEERAYRQFLEKRAAGTPTPASWTSALARAASRWRWRWSCPRRKWSPPTFPTTRSRWRAGTPKRS